MSIKEKLALIQNEMNVPKNMYNSFGKYHYRNAETILSVAKPICKKYKSTVYTVEKPIQIGDRYYIQSIAYLLDWESDEEVEAIASAREPEDKKGMDESQITGSASSYAKKYALSGLFALDDNQDPDTEEYAVQTGKAPKKKESVFDEPVMDREKEKLIEDFFRRLSSNQVDFIYKKHGVNDAAELTVAQLKGYIDLQKSRENEKH